VKKKYYKEAIEDALNSLGTPYSFEPETFEAAKNHIKALEVERDFAIEALLKTGLRPSSIEKWSDESRAEWDQLEEYAKDENRIGLFFIYAD
jgi:hypothetical protein